MKNFYLRAFLFSNSMLFRHDSQLIWDIVVMTKVALNKVSCS